MDLSTAFSTGVQRESSEFSIRSALHDLRNHLHGVVGLMNLLSHGVRMSGDADTLQVAIHSLDLLSQQVDRLTSSYTGNPVTLTPHRPCPERLTRSLGVLFAAFAAAHGSTISTCVEEELPLVAVDPVSVSRLLTNLLINAIKHAAARSITITASRRDDLRVCISIQDDGNGLTFAERERIGSVLRGESRNSGYARTGIASCAEMSLSSGIALELCPEDGSGVRWDVLVPMWREARPEPVVCSHGIC